MALTAGARLGPYEILAPLGAGGMGEVYKARDPRLDRTVAIKILPSRTASDPDARARFEREARAVAALDHPHICAVYDVGREQDVDFIVMQYLDGETLADRLAKGPLPLDQVLRHAAEIAGALDRAHRHGVVHRDIKPANIVLTKTGVKILDFGLARLAPAGGPVAGMSTLPTAAPNLTDKGTIVGTLQYMAPEQLEGRDADARTDIFALGTVIFEMATGRKAFTGTSQASVITSIMSSEPAPITTLVPLAPSGLDHIVAVCLAKDPDDRWQSARDVERELKWIVDARSPHDAQPSSIRQRRPGVAAALVVGFVVGGVAAGLAVRSVMQSRSVTRAVTRSVILLPPGGQLIGGMALSPDGRTVVFSALTEGSRARLYVRSMGQLVATPIAGAEPAAYPFFSPNGQWVAFYSDRKIKKVALSGGAPQVVCDSNGFVSATWGDNNMIVFTPTSGVGLSQVSADGGTPQALTTPDRGQREKTHRDAEVLPGGHAVLFTVGTADMTTFDDARIEVLTIATGQRKVLIRGGMFARYVPTGHLVYARSGSLLAVPFDVNRLEVTGPPVVLVEGVDTDPDGGLASFAIAHDGSLVYAPGAGTTIARRLVWVDRQGRDEAAIDLRRPFSFPRVSPDGRRIAVTLDQATGEIWVYDVVRTTFTRLVAGWDNLQPAWSADGTRIAFNSNRGTVGGRNLFWQLADGTSAPERLMPDTGSDQYAETWSPDGRFLVFSQWDTGASGDLWVMSLDDRKPRPLLRTSASESAARISPDGRWIAYESDQSGRPEVYVQAFPGPSRTWQVSLDGGHVPVWAPNGGELFYRRGASMMAADIAAGSEFRVDKPKRLFDVEQWSPGRPAFDVARDGRFLVIKNDERPPITQLNLAQNWTEELKARVPTK